MYKVLRMVFYFAVISAISPLAFANEPIKLHSASDFNKQPSTMIPNFPAQSTIDNTKKNTPPTNAAPIQNSAPYYNLNIPSAPPTSSSAATAAPSSATSPSNTSTSNSGVLLDSSDAPSKNTDPSSASSWVIH